METTVWILAAQINFLVLMQVLKVWNGKRVEPAIDVRKWAGMTPQFTDRV